MYPSLELMKAMTDDRERRLRDGARSREARLVRKTARAERSRRRGIRLRDPLKA
jgi:hypothetical protein